MKERRLSVDEEIARSIWTPGGEIVNQLQVFTVLVGMLEFDESLFSQGDIDEAISRYTAKYSQYGQGNPEIISLLEQNWTKDNLAKKYLKLNKLVFAEKDKEDNR